MKIKSAKPKIVESCKHKFNEECLELGGLCYFHWCELKEKNIE